MSTESLFWGAAILAGMTGLAHAQCAEQWYASDACKYLYGEYVHTEYPKYPGLEFNGNIVAPSIQSDKSAKTSNGTTDEVYFCNSLKRLKDKSTLEEHVRHRCGFK